MTAALERTDWPTPTRDIVDAERDLHASGICIMPGVLSGRVLTKARDALYRAAEFDASRGARQAVFGLDRGEGNHRVWNVLSRDPVFVDLVQHPLALRLVRSVLGWPALLGNLSANITRPGAEGGLLHADQIFVPEPWPPAPQGCNVTWLLDPFTKENGATQFIPGSHRLNRLPEPEDHFEPRTLEGEAGTMVVFDSRIWHRTGENITGDVSRAGLFGWYTRPIYRTQENWFLSLSPWVLEGASDDLLTLLAWRSEGFGLVNGRSPR